jgi:predicted enzyme related to lactoylglutathione lyase
MINYRVDNLDELLEELRKAGVQVEDNIEENQYGRFGWAFDPAGNKFELWQPRGEEGQGEEEWQEGRR